MIAHRMTSDRYAGSTEIGHHAFSRRHGRQRRSIVRFRNLLEQRPDWLRCRFRLPERIAPVELRSFPSPLPYWNFCVGSSRDSRQRPLRYFAERIERADICERDEFVLAKFRHALCEIGYRCKRSTLALTDQRSRRLP